jgi:hypothetical protein
LYFLPGISKEDELGGHAARMGAMKSECSVSVRKPEGNRPPGIPRRGCVDNIKIDLEEMGWECVDRNWWWLVNTVMKLMVP